MCVSVCVQTVTEYFHFQFTEEKFGQAEKTELDAHLENLLVRAENTKQWTERIMKQTEVLLQPNPSKTTPFFVFVMNLTDTLGLLFRTVTHQMLQMFSSKRGHLKKKCLTYISWQGVCEVCALSCASSSPRTRMPHCCSTTTAKATTTNTDGPAAGYGHV